MLSDPFRSSRVLARLVTTLILLMILQVVAQAAPIVNDAPRPSLTVPQASLKPALTAQVDDPAWTSAVTLPDMTVSLGAPAPTAPLPQTKVQLLWDADYLYVRFICHDTEIYTPVHGHDSPIYSGDAVEIFLDPVGDAHQWIELEFNADDDYFDQMFLCIAEPKHDESLCLTGEVVSRDTWNFLSWDMQGLRSKAARLTPTANEQNWIVDIAIPAKELLHRLGLKQLTPMTLRGDFIRYKYLPSEPGKPRHLLPLNWSPVATGRPHRCPAAYGYINLVNTVPASNSNGTPVPQAASSGN
jgi:hypothetical protein